MSYYKILGFDKEPFSTSPDPEFFYLSREHQTALTKVLIELNLERGLSVVLGDVGTGKTSLSRKLIQELSEQDNILLRIIFDPSFESENQLMRTLMGLFEIPVADGRESSTMEMKDLLQRFLLHKSVVEKKKIVLVIDEAQKLNEMSLEVLRVLLNYETNEFKLLQLVLLGQKELFSKISGMANFFDRISFKYTLFPFNLEETKEMIQFRVRQAGYKAKMQLFLNEAIQKIYEATQGYPRRITMMCHNALKDLVLKKRYVVDAGMIEDIIQSEIRSGWYTEDQVSRKINF